VHTAHIPEADRLLSVLRQSTRIGRKRPLEAATSQNRTSTVIISGYAIIDLRSLRKVCNGTLP